MNTNSSGVEQLETRVGVVVRSAPRLSRSQLSRSASKKRANKNGVVQVENALNRGEVDRPNRYLLSRGWLT